MKDISMENGSPMTEDEKTQLIQKARSLVLYSNTPPDKIESALCDKGMNAQEAHEVVLNLLREKKTSAKGEGGSRDIAIGALLLLGGVIFSFISYSMAANGGSYIVTVGAIGVGAGRLIRGVLNRG